MKKPVMFVSVLVLLVIFLPAATAGTNMFNWEPPWAEEIPEMEPMEWADGQSATYNISVDVEGETIEADLRFALVGEETVEGEDYHWFELDVFNIGELPEDMMIDEDFESVKVKILMKEYNFTFTKDNPEEFMEDLFSLEFINRVIFQMNDDTPYEIDMSFLQMFAPMMEMTMQEMEGMEDEEMTEIMEDIDWGYETETVTTPADTFADALHLWFEMGDESGNVKMNIYAHEDVPLSVLVKVVGEIKDNVSGENIDILAELVEIGTDAESWITGTPEMFSFDMMGGMGPGMMMDDY